MDGQQRSEMAERQDVGQDDTAQLFAVIDEIVAQSLQAHVQMLQQQLEEKLQRGMDAMVQYCAKNSDILLVELNQERTRWDAAHAHVDARCNQLSAMVDSTVQWASQVTTDVEQVRAACSAATEFAQREVSELRIQLDMGELTKRGEVSSRAENPEVTNDEDASTRETLERLQSTVNTLQTRWETFATDSASAQKLVQACHGKLAAVEANTQALERQVETYKVKMSTDLSEVKLKLLDKAILGGFNCALTSAHSKDMVHSDVLPGRGELIRPAGQVIRRPRIDRDRGTEETMLTATPMAASPPKTYAYSFSPRQQTRSPTPRGLQYRHWSGEQCPAEASIPPSQQVSFAPAAAGSKPVQRGLSPTSFVRRSVSYSQVPSARVVPAATPPAMAHHRACSPPQAHVSSCNGSAPAAPFCNVGNHGSVASTPGSPRRPAPRIAVPPPSLSSSSVAPTVIAQGDAFAQQPTLPQT